MVHRVGHRCQCEVEGTRHSGSRLDGLDELDLGAVQMGHQGHVGPQACDGIVLGREVMEVEQVSTFGAGGGKGCLPHR